MSDETDRERADALRAAAREYGRLMAARRRQIEATCAVCGKPIVGTGKRRYCGPNCRAKAYYQRKTGKQSPAAE